MHLQLDENNIVRDAIEYPHPGYIEVDVPMPLPIGLIGGWYRWENGAFAFDQQLYGELNEQTDMLAALELLGVTPEEG